MVILILTVTINPSVDKTFVMKKFVPHEVNHANRIIYNAGSKGINVSRVVQLLGQQACALGFVGGATGEILLSKLSEEGINHDLVHAKNFQTRLNIKIMDMSINAVTDLNELGDAVSDADFEVFLKRYNDKLATSDIIVISGSLLPEMSNRMYYDLTMLAKVYGKPVFLDCGGVVLREGIKASPYCIKPNIKEFEEMLGKSNLSQQQILDECRNIININGVTCVVVTLGSDGAIGVTKDVAYKIIPPDVTVSSTVGAGDAFLAGMCHGYLKGMNFSNQLIFGTSCASAKITKQGNDIPSIIELLGYSDGCRIVQL